VVQDSVVSAVLAGKVLSGDPDGHAALYDRYATGLYEYCVSMLRDTDRAVGAFGITFMIAAGRLAELRDRSRLRPWLFALARDECRRRGPARPGTGAGRTDPGHTAPGHTGAAALFTAAMAGLSWDDREVIELCLRQHLIGDDLADALGLAVGRAQALFGEARPRLQRALGAVFVARTGQTACPELARQLAGWNGQPSPSLVEDVRAHIASCARCEARELRDLPSWEALTEPRRPAQAMLPADVRADVLALLAKVTAPPDDLIADLVLHRAGALGADGFPGRRPLRERRSPAQVAAAAAGVAAAGTVVVMFTSMPGAGSPAPAPSPSPARAANPQVIVSGPHATSKPARGHESAARRGKLRP